MAKAWHTGEQRTRLCQWVVMEQTPVLSLWWPYLILHLPSMSAASLSMPGYHLTSIEKGVIGESSKLLEEVLELIDAEQQDCKLMALLELADLVGAIELYLAKHAPSFSLNDLIKMSAITRRAFENGHRH